MITDKSTFLVDGLESPILFEGSHEDAYRDPTVYYKDGIFYLYFTYVDAKEEEPYLYTAMSTSRDLKEWSPMVLLTPRDRSLNYSSPGNIIEYGDTYYMCLQTYCRENGEKYGNANSRVYLMASKDLINWGEPEPIMVKGDAPIQELGRMIDPYIIVDKEDNNKFWCFYKQNGASYSWSKDLKHWEYGGSVSCGENVCVLNKEDSYLIFHSPHNGIGVLESKDLRKFNTYMDNIYLGQENWSWAKGRLTAGFVIDLRHEPSVGKYLMFFHGSGPEDESVYFDTQASIGIAWSEDLMEWHWPGK